MRKNFKKWFYWIKKRLREKSTWLGIVIVVGTYLGKEIGWIHNMEDGIGFMIFGGSLMSYSSNNDPKEDETDQQGDGEK